MSDDLAAWAALAAAVTSVVTLVVTTVVSGRRERTAWSREALTDAFVAFLDASWRGSDAVKERAARAADGDDARAEEQERQSWQAYEEMRTQLTRLRLLASERVRLEGETLLRRQRAAHQAAEPQARLDALRAAAAQRRVVVEVAKQEMGLP